MRMRRWIVAVGAGVLIALIVPDEARGQQDKIRSTQVGWAWQYGASSATIDAQVAAGLRPFAFQRVAPSQYDTVYVSNSGAYAVTGSDVFFNLDSTGLSSALALGGKRILDLEPYDIGSGPRFNAIVVPNSGATAASGWEWGHGLTWPQVVTWLASRPTLRPIDIDYYTTGGVDRYSVVAVPNTGTNFQAGWWIGTGQRDFEVQDAMEANDARILDIEVTEGGSSGQFTEYAYIMIPRGTVRSDWFANYGSEYIPELVEQVASRIVCLERFEHFGMTRYSVVTVSNADAQTSRVRDYLMGDDRGLSEYPNSIGGTMGFMLKEVGGPVITTINPEFMWEPASTYKLLHAVYALWRCSIWVDALGSNVQYRNISNVSQIITGCTSCPFDWTCGPVNIRLDETLRYLLEPSSNTALIALENRYGVANINAFADARGFGNIESIRQDCECAVTLNTATCTDICEMMEQVADGSIFATPWREVLFTLMNDLDEQGYPYWYETLSDVIDQEAAGTLLTAPEIADFREAMRFANKGGYYDCGEFYKTEGGWASIPFKGYAFDTYFTYAKEYVFAVFIHASNDGPGSDIVYSGKEEIVREQIREALESWDDACDTPWYFDQPDSIVRVEGQDAVFTAQLVGGGEGGAYQWQKAVGGGFWINLVTTPGNFGGATTDTLTIYNIDANDAGTYRLTYDCVCGDADSVTATLTVTPAPDCPGDITGDGTVTIADFNILAGNFGQASGAGPEDGDLTGDGAVNIADFNILASNFGAVCP